MRCAIIENGVVVNIAIAELEYAQDQGWVSSGVAQIGDTWDGETFISPPAPPPDPEGQWDFIRIERNRRLADCDWTQLPDAPVDTAAWAVYRQALRDITLQPDPFNIVWPIEPGA